jgi:hypothetical protein
MAGLSVCQTVCLLATLGVPISAGGGGGRHARSATAQRRLEYHHLHKLVTCKSLPCMLSYVKSFISPFSSFFYFQFSSSHPSSFQSFSYEDARIMLFIAKRMADRRRHDAIRKEAPTSAFCGHCGSEWPVPINIEHNTRTPSQSPRTTPRAPSQSLGPALSRTGLITRDRTTNFTNHFTKSAQEATQACRQGRKATLNPYEHPLGLWIQMTPILSFGVMQYGFFTPSKTSKLRTYE